MNNSKLKKIIPLFLAVFTLTGIGFKITYDSKSESVYAETIFQSKIASETEELQKIMGVESSELEVNQQLSSEENVVYEDKDNNLYEVQDEEITSFFSMEEDANSPELSEEQIKAMAEEYLDTLAKADKYVLYNEKYNKYTETYRYYYYYYLGEYKTTDVVYIEIDKNGNIKSFAKPQEGVFENVDIKLLSKEEIETRALENTYYNREAFNIHVTDIIIEKEESVKYRVSLECKELNSDMVYTDVVYVKAEG